MPDSNVYGPVLGLWRSSNPFHSPIRETLYSLPYPLRIERHPDERAVPHATRTFGAVIGAGVAPEHVEFADTINRRGQSDAIYQGKSKYRLRSVALLRWEICWTLDIRSFPARPGTPTNLKGDSDDDG